MQAQALVQILAAVSVFVSVTGTEIMEDNEGSRQTAVVANDPIVGYDVTWFTGCGM